MAEFREVLKQWGRLCSQHCAKHNDDCDGCLLGGTRADVCAAYARDCADASEDIENLVMQWAAEHPEPVYPTWIEWLRERGIIPTCDEAIKSMISGTRAASFFVTAEAFRPIPADIAQKLGIEPKEET